MSTLNGKPLWPLQRDRIGAAQADSPQTTGSAPATAQCAQPGTPLDTNLPPPPPDWHRPLQSDQELQFDSWGRKNRCYPHGCAGVIGLDSKDKLTFSILSKEMFRLIKDVIVSVCT